MRYKAVVFDLFETLITEWGHKKYTKREMCADLGVDKDAFDPFWEEKEEERYIGKISFEDSILYACGQCGKKPEQEIFEKVIAERVRTKAECFRFIQPELFQLLKALREQGLKTAILSNCSSEEVTVIRESELYQYFDEVILSFEVGMKKPDACIYEEALRRLGITPDECIFVGDGGSRELEGAKSAGIKAVQAKWYTDQFPVKRKSMEGFPTALKPMDVMKFIGDEAVDIETSKE